MTTKPKTKKAFDCIEYKRNVQLRIYEDIKNLTPQQEIEYFRKKAEEGSLGDWWKSVKNATRPRKTD